MSDFAHGGGAPKERIPTLTKAEHDRMVAKQGRPVTVKPDHYNRIGFIEVDDHTLRPKGQKAPISRKAA